MRIRQDIVDAYRENPTSTKEELSSLVTTCAKNGVMYVDGNKIVIQYFSDTWEELTVNENDYSTRPTSRSEIFPDEYSTIQFNPGV